MLYDWTPGEARKIIDTEFHVDKNDDVRFDVGKCSPGNVRDIMALAESLGHSVEMEREGCLRIVNGGIATQIVLAAKSEQKPDRRPVPVRAGEREIPFHVRPDGDDRFTLVLDRTALAVDGITLRAIAANILSALGDCPDDEKGAVE